MIFRDTALSPYSGSEPFVFLSYSHRDAAEAGELIRMMKSAGFRVWYDEGLIPGAEWDEAIAKKIRDCSYMIALISRNYIESANCRDELNYARDLDKPRLLVYLEQVELPDGMAMRLGRLQAVFRYRDGARIYDRIAQADGIGVCRETRSDPFSDPAPAAGAAAQQPRKASAPGKWLVPVILAAAALVVLAVLLAAGVFRGSKPQPTPSSAPAETAEAPAGPETGATDSAPLTWENRLREDVFIPDFNNYNGSLSLFENYSIVCAMAENEPAFGLPVLRGEVRRLVFLSSTEGAPDDAADLSAGGDGSVLAWTEGNGGVRTLTIAADGGLRMPEELTGMFAGYSNLKEISWNGAVSFADAEDLRYLFAGCESLREPHLEELFDLHPSNLVMAFFRCRSLTSLDLSGLDSSGVMSMAFLFFGCDQLKTLNLDPGRFDTSNVRDMRGMFANCSALTELDLSGFDTAHVEDMEWMFLNCYALQKLSLDPLRFSTANVVYMNCMFQSCISVQGLDLSFFDFSNVQSTEYMFSGFASADPLCFTGAVPLDDSMFRSCQVPAIRFDGAPSRVSPSAFDGCTALVHYPAEAAENWSGLIEASDGVRWVADRVLSETPGPDGCEAENLFDDSYETVWRAAFDGEAVVEWCEPAPLRMTGYVMRYQSGAAEGSGPAPAAWKLYGKAEPTGEYVLLAQHSGGWSRESSSFSSQFNSPRVNADGGRIAYASLRECRYFRLVVTATDDPDAEVVRLSDLQLLDDEEAYTRWYETGEW